MLVSFLAEILEGTLNSKNTVQTEKELQLSQYVQMTCSLQFWELQGHTYMLVILVNSGVDPGLLNDMFATDVGIYT